MRHILIVEVGDISRGLVPSDKDLENIRVKFQEALNKAQENVPQVIMIPEGMFKIRTKEIADDMEIVIYSCVDKAIKRKI